METTISLPPHLHAALATLLDPQVLDEELDELLKSRVKPEYDASSKEVPYDLLRRVSQWAQSSEGKDKLTAQGLDPHDYLMIALLAGTVTAPSAKLAPWKPPLSPEEQAIAKARERKAIAALINGFLSVIGVGVAAWFAAGSIGMRSDHKVLLALFSAIGVAATEGTLYWIWQWRYEQALKGPKHRSAKSKKDGPSPKALPEPDSAVSVKSSGVPQPEDTLRKRPRKEKATKTKKGSPS